MVVIGTIGRIGEIPIAVGPTIITALRFHLGSKTLWRYGAFAWLCCVYRAIYGCLREFEEKKARCGQGAR